MNHHDTSPATADTSSSANRDPSDISAYVPSYVVPANRYMLYGVAKRAWLADHPECTSEQYELAVQAIAAKLGV